MREEAWRSRACPALDDADQQAPTTTPATTLTMEARILHASERYRPAVMPDDTDRRRGASPSRRRPGGSPTDISNSRQDQRRLEPVRRSRRNQSRLGAS